MSYVEVRFSEKTGRDSTICFLSGLCFMGDFGLSSSSTRMVGGEGGGTGTSSSGSSPSRGRKNEGRTRELNSSSYPESPFLSSSCSSASGLRGRRTLLTGFLHLQGWLLDNILRDLKIQDTNQDKWWSRLEACNNIKRVSRISPKKRS